jgi:hypothetical protein
VSFGRSAPIESVDSPAAWLIRSVVSKISLIPVSFDQPVASIVWAQPDSDKMPTAMEVKTAQQTIRKKRFIESPGKKGNRTVETLPFS